MKRFSFIPLALVGLALLTGGCQHSPTQKATVIRQTIEDKTVQINASVDSAQEHIKKADDAVVVATTQPSNPPATKVALGTAHTELGAASTALAPVRPATVVIATNAVAAEQVTATVTKQLTAEQNHWIGAKGRKLLWTIGTIGIIGSVFFAIVVFIMKTNGFGPLAAAADSAIVGVLSVAWTVVKKVPVVIYHIATLGASKFADLVNFHWDKQNTPTK